MNVGAEELCGCEAACVTATGRVGAKRRRPSGRRASGEERSMGRRGRELEAGAEAEAEARAEGGGGAGAERREGTWMRR